MNVIKSSAQIGELFNEGTRYSTAALRILVKQIDDERDLPGRVAFIAGKKLGCAVVRNRCKRLLRAAAHMTGLPVDGYDIVLMATPRTASVSSLVIAQDLKKLLARAGIV